MKIIIEKTVPEAKIPVRQKDCDSGADLYPLETFVLGPRQTRLFMTGLKLQLPPNVEAQIRSRSGLAKKYGICVLNSPGTVDNGYRGEVGVILHNTSNDKWYTVDPSRAIAQIVFAPVLYDVTFVEEMVNSTERGDGGFGHTGGI